MASDYFQSIIHTQSLILTDGVNNVTYSIQITLNPSPTMCDKTIKFVNTTILLSYIVG